MPKRNYNSTPPAHNESAHVKWCPHNCTFQAGRKPAQLETKDISKTHRKKHCKFCKWSVTFLRNDTPEGRKQRMKDYYDLKIKPTIVPKSPGEPKTSAERMRLFRAKRREENQQTETHEKGILIPMTHVGELKSTAHPRKESSRK